MYIVQSQIDCKDVDNKVSVTAKWLKSNYVNLTLQTMLTGLWDFNYICEKKLCPVKLSAIVVCIVGNKGASFEKEDKV